MGGSRAKELYRRLGPVLYARANRATKDSKLAERLTREVTLELAALGDLEDSELLKRGRARMAELFKESSSGALDSLPRGGTPRR